MNWDAFFKIGLLALGLGIALYIPAYLWVKYVLRKHPERWEKKYTTPLSKRTVVLSLFAVGLLFLIIVALTIYVYPWFGVPVIGYTGLAPFFVACVLVGFALSPFQIFRNNKPLLLAVSLPIGVVIGVLFLWYLGSSWFTVGK